MDLQLVVSKICDALVYLLDNMFIRFETKLYRQTIGILMGTNGAPLVADLFLFCYENDFMRSLSRENQADIIEAFNSTSRYLDELLNIDNIYFDQMVDRIYSTKLQLNRANSSDTEAPFLDLNLPWVLNFPPCRGPGGSIPTGNVASVVSSNCPLWEERRENTARLPWVAARKPEEGILEVESYWEYGLS